MRSNTFRGWLLCSPALLVMAVFFMVPAMVGFWISLHEWDGISTTMPFVGLDNYAELFASDRFWRDMTINWVFALGTLVLQMPIALALAVTLSRKGRGFKIYRMALFLPQVLSIAAVALIWTLMYDPVDGLINQALEAVGLGALSTPWLGEPGIAVFSVLVASTWFYFGFHMILFIAGIAAIPQDYYDAARLETNRLWTVTRCITLPLIREQLLISFVLIVSGAFGHLVGLVSLMTSGGPAGGTELLGLFMNNLALRGGQFGVASALSVIMLVVVVVIVGYPALRIARIRVEL